MFGGRNLADSLQTPGTPTPTRRLTRRPEAIYTFGKGDASCCVAVQAGFSYGINSIYARQHCPRHQPVFVDNGFKRYDHATHRAVVNELRPRYATVRDLMTPEQCQEAGIAYYPPEQILAWYADLKPLAQQVILIPKDVRYLDLCPAGALIGVPVPSQYGADALPLACYRDRRVHLLGGSWARQLSYLYALGDAVVSFDTNQIQRLARYGQYIDPAGQPHSLRNLLPFDTTNALLIAFSISCGSIQAALDRLYESA